MTKPEPAKKLTLRRETLRSLTPGELRLVAGGGQSYGCTGTPPPVRRYPEPEFGRRPPEKEQAPCNNKVSYGC